MNNTKELIIIGAGPAGLMAARTAAKKGLTVLVIEKKKDITKITRTCSAQFVLDEDYERETLKIDNGKVSFLKNGFDIPYSGRTTEILYTNYFSSKGHRVRFAHKNGRPCSVKFDKGQLLKGLLEECMELGVEFRFESVAMNGADEGTYVKVETKTKNNTETITAKKLIIAEGANARLTGVFGFNKGRKYFGMPFIEGFTLAGTKGFEENSWNQFYGSVYHPFSEVIVGAGIDRPDTVEVTIMGTKGMYPNVLFQKMITESPLKKNFEDAKIIGKTGCSVKSYVSLQEPCKGNVLVIGDSAAHVEVIVQGAIMCGFHAGNAIAKELNGEDGFTYYTNWWKNAFNFNRGDCMKFVQFYETLGLRARFSDDEIDYLFQLLDGETLSGNFSQFEVPMNLWRAFLAHKDKMNVEMPALFEKVQPIIEYEACGLI